ncbi:hypothetical protein BJX63DRAFT_15002 [Aspergillus granulosus]|uniref:Uncharacterized protein n=1 Tax=Aspergillus granulosus TaxID=176169 RepID=A0ABR4H0J4_9EURO
MRISQPGCPTQIRTCFCSCEFQVPVQEFKTRCFFPLPTYCCLFGPSCLLFTARYLRAVASPHHFHSKPAPEQFISSVHPYLGEASCHLMKSPLQVDLHLTDVDESGNQDALHLPPLHQEILE